MKKFIKANQLELIFALWYLSNVFAIIYYWSEIFSY
jgi:hypothetical protein